MMKFLLTGFESFGDISINPSQRLIESLPDQIEDGTILQKLILPVDKQVAPQLILSAINVEKPDVILAFGLASGRAKISLERVAINLMDFKIPDNAGSMVLDQPVIENGSAAYFSTLPIQTMLNALIDAGIPAEISLSAGSYLCNQVFYSVIHEIAIKNSQTWAGFIHLPALPEEVARSKKSIPSMPLAIMVKAAKTMILCLTEQL